MHMHAMICTRKLLNFLHSICKSLPCAGWFDGKKTVVINMAVAQTNIWLKSMSVWINFLLAAHLPAGEEGRHRHRAAHDR